MEKSQNFRLENTFRISESKKCLPAQTERGSEQVTPHPQQPSTSPGDRENISEFNIHQISTDIRNRKELTLRAHEIALEEAVIGCHCRKLGHFKGKTHQKRNGDRSKMIQPEEPNVPHC